MMRARIRNLLIAIAVATGAALSHGQSPYEKNLEIRTSTIPHAGNGVFAKVAIRKGAYLGAYTGERGEQATGRTDLSRGTDWRQRDLRSRCG